MEIQFNVATFIICRRDSL